MKKPNDNAIATQYGWVDKNTGELLVATSKLENAKQMLNKPNTGKPVFAVEKKEPAKVEQPKETKRAKK